MPGAHRHDDSRFCGAITKVSNQTTVEVNGKLWAVVGDKDTHCDSGALKAVYGQTVYINNINVICAVGDTADEDKAGCIVVHPPGATDPLGHSSDVIVYGGGAGGGSA